MGVVSLVDVATVKLKLEGIYSQTYVKDIMISEIFTNYFMLCFVSIIIIFKKT